MSEEYNGWANRETWVVNLWLSNDEWVYREAGGLARESGERADEALKQYVDDLVEDEYDKASGMLTDLINSALGRVDWREIAHAFSEVEA